MAGSEDLIERLTRLNVDRSHGDPAPHKPLMLLAVLDLVEEGTIRQNHIEHNPELIERFSNYWAALGRPSVQVRHWLPFFHLRSEGFWELSPRPDAERQLTTMGSPKSNRQLHDAVSHAKLSDEAWSLIQSEEARMAMRSALLSTFTELDRSKLLETIREGQEQGRYVDELLERAHREPFRVQHDEPPTATTTRPVRDKAFRRLIRRLYDDTCSMCELRLVTEEGRSVLAAAHIIPYAKSYNDDPRNGLGLCPVHHWCYDEGLIGVSPDYVVVVSDSLTGSQPTEDRVISLRGRQARLPSNDVLHPAREALQRHCDKHSLSA